MKIRLIMLSISCLAIGLAYATNRPIADKHVFAPTEPAGAVQAASTTSPSPAGVSADQSSDSAGAGTVLAISSTPAPVRQPLPAVSPVASPEPTAEPVPTLQPEPQPTILPPRCGGCGPWPGPGHHPEIMCPMYCVD
jgi:hypothetical protein